jgi:hypothetical protein
MDDKVLIAIVSASSAIGGGLITGFFSMWANKNSADREDRRRTAEVQRQKAEERINDLYAPLLNLMTPNPPYDEFYFEPELQVAIINKIEKNEIYASPELLSVFWDFKYAYYNDSEKIDTELDVKIFRIVDAEHSALKKIIGHGRILRKDSFVAILWKFLKKIFGPLFKKVQDQYFSLKFWVRSKRRKRTRK